MALLSRHYRAWTAAENRQLRELARKQMSPRLLVMRLGRTVDAIRAQAAKEGISLKLAIQPSRGSKQSARTA